MAETKGRSKVDPKSAAKALFDEVDEMLSEQNGQNDDQEEGGLEETATSGYFDLIAQVNRMHGLEVEPKPSPTEIKAARTKQRQKEVMLQALATEEDENSETESQKERRSEAAKEKKQAELEQEKAILSQR